jgi:hypothetical protein
MKWYLVLAIILFAGPSVRAAEEAIEAPAGAARTTEHDAAAAEHGENADVSHPVVLEPGPTWPGQVVIVILGMFLAAAIVGPVVRANAPEEVPPAHSHDEPPGTSHHHGKSGTLNPEPDHGHANDDAHH